MPRRAVLLTRGVTGRLRRRRQRRCKWRGDPGNPGAVVPHGGSGVGVGGGFLYVAQWPAGVNRGDERVTQRMRPDGLCDSGPAGYLSAPERRLCTLPIRVQALRRVMWV